MSMSYEEEVEIGANINSAVERGLREHGFEDRPEGELGATIATIAQNVLVQLDQAGYQIVRK